MRPLCFDMLPVYRLAATFLAAGFFAVGLLAAGFLTAERALVGAFFAGVEGFAPGLWGWPWVEWNA